METLTSGNASSSRWTALSDDIYQGRKIEECVDAYLYANRKCLEAVRYLGSGIYGEPGERLRASLFTVAKEFQHSAETLLLFPDQARRVVGESEALADEMLLEWSQSDLVSQDPVLSSTSEAVFRAACISAH